MADCIVKFLRILSVCFNFRKRKAVEDGLPEPEFAVTAQFMELYNEEIKDLFDISKGSLAGVSL